MSRRALKVGGHRSSKKLVACAENFAKATAARAAAVNARTPWECAECGTQYPATVHQMRKTYCSSECMSKGYAKRMAGSANPNYKGGCPRVCTKCGGTYHSYNKRSRFCSLECSGNQGEKMRAAKKDANHISIVDALEAGGVRTMDLSKLGYGVPDLLVWCDGAYHLIEIKNPKTRYGKSGLNGRQRDWAANWNTPVHILRTVEDAAKFVAGDRESLWAKESRR